MTTGLNDGGRLAASDPGPGTPAPLPPAGVPGAPGSLRQGPRRADDRRVAVASVAVAAAYLVAAAGAAVALAAGATTATPWLPLHLALAGGASTAIAGVMPFFVAALSAGRPAPARLRAASVALVAIGAGLVATHGVWPGLSVGLPLPAIGGVVYLAGIAMTAAAVRASGRGGLMARRPIVTVGYLLALLNVGIGGTLGTLVLAGWEPAASHLVMVRAAHAWTNLIGFVSLVILATLLHFLPTVLGTRIVPRRSATVAVLGVALGSPLVVVGFLSGAVAVAAGGAVLTLVGIGGLVAEARAVRAARGRWTTDAGWHLVASGGLLAGVAWFAVGAGLASLLVLARSAGITGDDLAWRSAIVAGPLAVGWVVQVLVASWTHLLPSIGPGGPVEHAVQRALLGRAAMPRLAALNAGVAMLALGWPTGIAALAAGGALLAAAAVVVSAGLAWSALGVRARR
jgi:nitrite reductase (NO-forming)